MIEIVYATVTFLAVFLIVLVMGWELIDILEDRHDK